MGPGGSCDLADAVDVGERGIAEPNLASDLLARAESEFGLPAERHATDAASIDQTQTHGRWLPGSGVTDAHVNREHANLNAE